MIFGFPLLPLVSQTQKRPLYLEATEAVHIYSGSKSLHSLLEWQVLVM